MSTTPFGTPVMHGESATDTPTPQANGHSDPSNAPQDILDPNDPRLTSEALDVNTDADAYAQPAPPPDARYRAKLTLEQVQDDKQQRHDYLPKLSKKPPIQAYFFTGIKATIIDPSGKYDGIPIYDRWVGTYLGRDGSTKVATILSRLKKPDGTAWIEKGKRYNHKEWIELLVKALAGEPELGIETIWEWSCQACGEAADKQGQSRPRSIMGMTKFPYNAQTKLYTPELKCQVNPAHGYSRARPSIARFLSLDELKQTQARLG
jgi:hypothetical protein